MNIQRLRKLTNILLIAICSIALLSCNAQEKLQVKEVFTGVKIDDANYEYAEDAMFVLQGENYSLRQKAVYNLNGDLEMLVQFKPEGKLKYNRDEILKDQNIIEYYGFPLKQNWEFKENELVDGANKIVVEKITADLLKREENGIISFYKLKQNLSQSEINKSLAAMRGFFIDKPIEFQHHEAARQEQTKFLPYPSSVDC